jgi:hypothetical protein
MYIYPYIYIYIYIYNISDVDTHTHTHTHICRLIKITCVYAAYQMQITWTLVDMYLPWKGNSACASGHSSKNFVKNLVAWTSMSVSMMDQLSRTCECSLILAWIKSLLLEALVLCEGVYVIKDDKECDARQEYIHESGK